MKEIWKPVVGYEGRYQVSSMGRVIGKQGRIAKAVRTVMRAGAAKNNTKVLLEIE